MSDNKTISKRDFLRKSVLTGAGAVGATALATPYVKAQAPIKWRLQTYAGPALADHVARAGDRSLQQGGQWRDGDRALHRRPAGAAGRTVPRRAVRHPRRRAERRRFDGLAGRRRRVRRLLPVCLALQPRRAGAVELVRPEGDLGGSLCRGARRDLAQRRRVGPLQLRHQQADPQPCRSQGAAHLHLPDRRAVHLASSASFR